MRFRRSRAQDIFDGLCERDAERLRAFLAHMAPTPVPSRPIDPGVPERRGTPPPTGEPQRKRGRRT